MRAKECRRTSDGRQFQGAPFALACAQAGVVDALAMGRWSIDLSAIEIPVDLWYGA
ncbi:hypothetical protein [Nocardia panacis]|uniref:hypothetical protein n=1 Tax=Nocardia panacis TaxID=2340916 RepID=UPI0013150684|nr:hypothetical protein [Nocardia panacis]